MIDPTRDPRPLQEAIANVRREIDRQRAKRVRAVMLIEKVRATAARYGPSPENDARIVTLQEAIAKNDAVHAIALADCAREEALMYSRFPHLRPPGLTDG